MSKLERSTYMLIDQHDRDILPLPREVIKGALDCGSLGLGVDYEVVLLAVGRVGDMLFQCRMVSFVLEDSWRSRRWDGGETHAHACEQDARHGVLEIEWLSVGCAA